MDTTTTNAPREQRRRSAWMLAMAMALPLLYAPGSARAQTDEPRVCDADTEVAIEFTDIAPDSVFCVEIGEFAASGITVGRADGTFGPGGTVTRGAMAAFLYRLAGSPEGPFEGPGFTDVGGGSTFATEIAWLATTGVTVGRPDGTFGSGGTVTRGAMAAFLYRLAGSPEGPFDGPGFIDVSEGSTFANEIAWLATTGVTVGRPDGTFGPGGTVTRGAMAAFLYRLAGSPEGPFEGPGFIDVGEGSTFATEIAWLATTGITVGRPDGTFGPGATVTRGAMAAFLTRYLTADLPILPQPPAQPVTVDLLLDADEFAIDTGGRPPTGTGGSAEGERRPYGFGLRSYAWHGQNASATAEGKLERIVDAASVLEDMPEQVTGVTAEVSYDVDAQAEVKGPWDRSSTFLVTVADLGGSGGTTLVKLTVEGDDDNPTQRTSSGTHTGSLTTTLTRDQPQTVFIMRGSCSSSSGAQVFAFFNEGYCDALEQGGIELRSLSVTFTPIIED